MSNTVVIAGASGVVGNAALEHYLEEGWDVVALSRREPPTQSTRPFRHVSVDLRDAEATKEALASVGEVTQLFYAALFELPGLIPGWSEEEQMRTNLAMLENVVQSLASAHLQHVVLLQGTKAYGVHLMPLRIPAKERQPRVQHDNFYWLQEDYLSDRAAQLGFTFTILRPQFIFGGVVGAAMNLVPVIGLYGLLCREQGMPFGFPGGAAFVGEASDPRLIARAASWALTAPAAANETFNITNGDVFTWREVWPTIALELGVELGPDRKRSLAEYLPSQEAAWAGMVDKYNLQRISLAHFLGESHHYADYSFGYEAVDRLADHGTAPAFLSTIKLRDAGFCGVYDTEDSFPYWIDVLRQRRLLPR
ncbi:MAG: SDR family oxidoreductase [Candidatus Nanopelagicales bacterium]